MGSSMKMSNYESDLDSMELEYGEEIMSVGWNPVIDLVAQDIQLMSVPVEKAAPAEAGIISEMFLRRMYSYSH